MAVSPTTERQTDEVLARASQLRVDLQRIVASVADGSLGLREVFERAATSPVHGFIYLVKVVEALPGVGKVRARRVLEAHGLGERSRVSEVPPAMQNRLVEAFA